MRTLTAIALATAMLFTVTAAQATTTTHKKHKSQHTSQTKKPKTDEKAGEKAK